MAQPLTEEEILRQQALMMESPEGINEDQLGQMAIQGSAIPPQQLSDQAAQLRQRLEALGVQNAQKEQQGIDDYAKNIKDFETQKQEYDLRPLAGLLDQWAGGGNLSQIAEGQKPQTPQEKLNLLGGMKMKLQEMQSGLSKSQRDTLKEQLSSIATEMKSIASERKATTSAGNSARDDESKMRNDWLKNPLTKNTQDVAVSYEKVKSAASDPSAAGDLSLIFGYMKMLDPGSTVREGEFANAQNAASVPDQVRNAWNRAQSGERLNANQRADFINQAKNVYKSQLEQQKRFNSETKRVASDLGFASDRVVMENMFKEAPAAKPAPAAGWTPDKQKRMEELQAKKAAGKL